MSQTAVQPYTKDQRQRLELLKSYSPKEHLITISSKQGGSKPYLPAAWRLYELAIRYPNANFSSEILLLDVERNLVVVKCRLYLGASYEQSEKKTEAMKSGPLSTLDKVETAAKARCARDFGISTELALDMDEEPDTEPAVNGTVARSSSSTPLQSDASELDLLKKRVIAAQKALLALYPAKAKEPEFWQTALMHIFDGQVPSHLSDVELEKIEAWLVSKREETKKRNGSK